MPTAGSWRTRLSIGNSLILQDLGRRRSLGGREGIGIAPQAEQLLFGRGSWGDQKLTTRIEAYLPDDQRAEWTPGTSSMRDAGRTNGAIEGPGPNLADLFLHRSRKRDEFRGYENEISFRHLTILKPGLCQR